MAFRRLRDTVVALAAEEQPMQLPAPTKQLSIDKVTIAVPGSGQVILSDISFELQSGHRDVRGSSINVLGFSTLLRFVLLADLHLFL